MVNVRHGSCLQELCMSDIKPAYRERHVGNGIINTSNKRCSHESCTTLPLFNVVGSKKGLYCKRHAEDGMVDVISKRCLYDLCTVRPSFNHVGSKSPAFCKQHAEATSVRMNPARSDRVSTSSAARSRYTANNMLLLARQTSVTGAVHMIPVPCFRGGVYRPTVRPLYAPDIRAI